MPSPKPYFSLSTQSFIQLWIWLNKNWPSLLNTGVVLFIIFK
jgi:hypothetical protein